MLPKDFENFDLRLKTLREESQELFESAEKLFHSAYEEGLNKIFPRDILGVKKYISGSFIIAYADAKHEGGEQVNTKKLFEISVKKSLATVPLSDSRKQELEKGILTLGEKSEEIETYFSENESISRDPFFALVEDFAIDGDISKEEFLLLSEAYEGKGSFLGAIESLPEGLRKLFISHISSLTHEEITQRIGEFESEYSSSLDALKNNGINTSPITHFIARSYYKTPKKFRKHESPARRLRRTMKMALLRLLRIKLGNIDAEKILKRFESGESFEDWFMLLFELLEVVNESPYGDEIYILLDVEEQAQETSFQAENTKEKILKGEALITSISRVVSEIGSDLEGKVLEQVLDESTHFHGDQVQFSEQESKMAGIYAENTTEVEDEEEEKHQEHPTPEAQYEYIVSEFHVVEEQKRLAFAEGNYDSIDDLNEKLAVIQGKLEKLVVILGISENESV